MDLWSIWIISPQWRSVDKRLASGYPLLPCALIRRRLCRRDAVREREGQQARGRARCAGLDALQCAGASPPTGARRGQASTRSWRLPEPICTHDSVALGPARSRQPVRHSQGRVRAERLAGASTSQAQFAEERGRRDPKPSAGARRRAAWSELESGAERQIRTGSVRARSGGARRGRVEVGRSDGDRVVT